MDSIKIQSVISREIKILRSTYLVGEPLSFEEIVNKYLKEGWSILDSASSTCVYPVDQFTNIVYSYTVTIYKEFWG